MKKAEELRKIFGEKALYRDETWHSPGGRAIREIVFGFNDGLVSTVGLVVGVASAFPDPKIILITGFAEMIAGGFSMFFGAYLSTKNQREFFEHEIDRELYEIEHMADHEKEEVRNIYSAKGFKGKDLNMIVEHITSDRNLWLKCMMEEELGLIFESMDNPLKVGITTAVSFMFGGILPLLPFFYFDALDGRTGSIALSAVSLFVVGVIKTHLTKKNWFKSGMESFLIGLFAAAVGIVFGKCVSIFTGGH